jgi:hypothetical protein
LNWAGLGSIRLGWAELSSRNLLNSSGTGNINMAAMWPYNRCSGLSYPVKKDIETFATRKSGVRGRHDVYMYIYIDSFMWNSLRKGTYASCIEDIFGLVC